MAIWFSLLATILPVLLKLLQELLAKREQLPPADRKKLNKILWQMGELDKAAAKAGCTPGGSNA